MKKTRRGKPHPRSTGLQPHYFPIVPICFLGRKRKEKSPTSRKKAKCFVRYTLPLWERSKEPLLQNSSSSLISSHTLLTTGVALSVFRKKKKREGNFCHLHRVHARDAGPTNRVIPANYQSIAMFRRFELKKGGGEKKGRQKPTAREREGGEKKGTPKSVWT